MKNLFFDTETTGLPTRYKANYADLDCWPRIVQLSWLISDDAGKILSESDYIVKVDFKIPEEASRIHGITNEVSDEKGFPIDLVLKAFKKDLKKTDRIICHNIGFDLPLLQSELYRNELDPEIKHPNFCTMLNSTNYCRIPGNRGYKWPRLEELYKICFGKKLQNAHNAKADVLATHKIFYHLKNENIFDV